MLSITGSIAIAGQKRAKFCGSPDMNEVAAMQEITKEISMRAAL